MQCSKFCMEFVKEFAIFLYKNDIIKFGNFTLSSGKQSTYYIDIRLLPSYPHQYRKIIKNLQNLISEQIGLEKFDSLASVPTGGLVIASSLAIEIVKPLIYVRKKQKEHGTSKLVEGKTTKGMEILMIDDVATTGESVVNALKILKKEGMNVNHAYVIINRKEGADKLLESEGVRLHQITDILEITDILYKENLIDEQMLHSVKNQVN